MCRISHQAVVHTTRSCGIILYTHTQVNDKPTHGQHDPKLMAHMSQYAPRMSQALKDHIWTQLSLGHIVKQIYDKHKAIWWAWVNVGEAMT